MGSKLYAASFRLLGPAHRCRTLSVEFFSSYYFLPIFVRSCRRLVWIDYYSRYLHIYNVIAEQTSSIGAYYSSLTMKLSTSSPILFLLRRDVRCDLDGINITSSTTVLHSDRCAPLWRSYELQPPISRSPFSTGIFSILSSVTLVPSAFVFVFTCNPKSRSCFHLKRSSVQVHLKYSIRPIGPRVIFSLFLPGSLDFLLHHRTMSTPKSTCTRRYLYALYSSQLRVPYYLHLLTPNDAHGQAYRRKEHMEQKKHLMQRSGVVLPSTSMRYINPLRTQ